MAVGLVDRQKLVNIADAVRAKKGITGNMTLDGIVSNIASIPTVDNNAKFDFTGSGSKSEGDLKSYFTNIDLSSFDTSNYTNMSHMFYNYPSLTSLDLSNFNTSKVTKMNGMFSNCPSLTSIDLSSFDTSKVTEMLGMFSSCKSLTSLDLSSFNTSMVTNMVEMFSNCSSLTSLDLSNFNTSKVTEMRSMFSNCSSLTSLNLSNFDTSMVTNMISMFDSCKSLTSIDLSNWNTSKVGTSSYASFKSMFYNCTSLESLDISSFDLSNTYGGSYYSLNSMFNECRNLKTLKLPNSVSFNKKDISLSNMFSSCNSLESLDFTGWDTTNVTIMNMLSGCISLKNLTLGENWASNSSITSFDLSYCPLTHDSAVDVLNKLATRDNSPVITFSNQVGLYQSEIDIATNKGWSVSGCRVLVDAETATKGQYALIEGELSRCEYVADTPQSWGQRIFVGPMMKDSNGKYMLQWGGYGTSTGVTDTAIGTGLSNTNALLTMNLQSTDGTPTIWDMIQEFRSTHSNRWFVPSRDEIAKYQYPDGSWSSTEFDTNDAYRGYDYNNHYAHVAKTSINRVSPSIYI